ncbi:uncharacterized protein [Penaeus vannamei]|uniref:uncharacterized protein n=1 Tax=Penaeus vannamei TaxID=6689 RepID=UPI00387F686B
MGVDKVAITTSEGTWELPLAAIFCIAIAVYVLLIIIGLSIRQCLLKKGVCGGGCPHIPCCNCAEMGLRCAQACSCCGPKPSCSMLLDCCCPGNQECTCLQLEACGPCPDCSECTSCTSCCENPCIDCNNCYNWCSAPSACAPGPLCDCSSCTCSCTTPECSTINCLCCEITIKGRGPQGDT